MLIYRVFRTQADWMCRKLLGTSYQKTLWDPQQTEGAHLIQWVSDTPSTVTEASFCCALFCVFMDHVIYSLELRVFIYDCYVKKKNSYKSYGRKFCFKFPNKICPSGDTNSKLVKKVQTHSILIETKPLQRNHVLTEEKLHDIGRCLENSPRKSLQWLALQSGDSVGSAWRATKLLHIRPYKLTVVPEIKHVDYE
jgi:hypothetical protein